MSRGNILSIRGVKRLEQFERGQSLRGKLLTGGNFTGVNFWGRIYLILPTKKTIWKIQVWNWFPLQILQRYSLFKYLQGPPPRHDLLWSVWKMSPKIGNFHLFYFLENYFIFRPQLVGTLFIVRRTHALIKR